MEIVEINHEIFKVMLSLSQIQEDQLSVSAEKCAQVLVRGLSLPSKSVVWYTDWFNMTLKVDWAINLQLKKKKSKKKKKN